jgi:hypothetical protein
MAMMATYFRREISWRMRREHFLPKTDGQRQLFAGKSQGDGLRKNKFW